MTILKLLWKYRIYVLCGIIAILSVIIIGMNDYTKMVKERLKTADNNFRIAQTDNVTFRTKLNRQASEAEALQLTIKQFQNLRFEDAKIIADLKVKLKNAEFYAKVATKTEYQFITTVKDSLIHDTIYPCFDYTNEYYHINGCFKGKQFFGRTFYVDTLSIVGSPVKKGWFIFKRVTGAKITVANLNPASSIKYNEFIQF